jgi:hypothetical protein
VTLWHACLVWTSGYATTFLLGFQSRNATAGHYGICAVTSFMIACAQVIGVRAVMEVPVLAALLLGSSGAAGICTAIAVNLHVFKLTRLK